MKIHIFTPNDETTIASYTYEGEDALYDILHGEARLVSGRNVDGLSKDDLLRIIFGAGKSISTELDTPLYLWRFFYYDAGSGDHYMAITTLPTIKAALDVMNVWGDIGNPDPEYTFDPSFYDGKVSVDRNLVFSPLRHNVAICSNGEHNHSLVFHGPIVPNDVL